LRVQFHPEAKEEFAEAALWYERQRRGLGAEFRAAVRKGARDIGDNPEAWLPWPDLPGVRSIPLRRFPYVLPYACENERAVVLAVAHAKRRPGYWRRRLRSI
jgi:plasmid stabilization system protein ParE